MVFLSSVVLAALVGTASANCALGTSLFPRLANVTVLGFGYDELMGPLNWFGLNETANSMCAHGQQQSPIVLNSSIPTISGSAVSWTVPDYPNGAVFENPGTNVLVMVNGSLVLNGTTFSLAQFHFHTPSEHRIDGEFYPMEMHWVFESEGLSYLACRHQFIPYQ